MRPVASVDVYGGWPYRDAMATSTARLEARIAPEQKKLIERAAALEGRSVTDFVIHSANAAAVRVIQERTSITLSDRDQETFVSALLEPVVPRGRLATAAARYRKRTR